MAHLWILVGCLSVSVSKAVDKLAHCSDTVSTIDSNLKVILGPGAKSHLCHYPPHVIDYASMTEQCSAFCGPKSIPLLLGTESSGFNLGDLDGFFLGNNSFLNHDEGLISECKDANLAIERIKLRLADFISSVRNITYAQQYFKAAMLDKIKKMQGVMFEEATRESIELAGVDQKMEKLTTILQDNLADIMSSGVLSMNLRDKLSNLKMKADLLDSTIKNELPKLKLYASECNQLLLGTSSNDEYLLDICSQGSAECIDKGKHIGCGCAINPAAGVFDIVGASSSGRRLTDDPDDSIETCGKAYEISQSAVDSLVDQILATTEGRRILEEFDAAQKELYKDFYTDCNARRLVEVGLDHDGKTAIRGANVQIETSQTAHALLENGPGHEEEASRQLQGSYLACNPPSQPTNPGAGEVTGVLKVAFSETTEEALCKNIQGMTEETLAQTCNDFCAPYSVPFMLGSLTYGFSHGQMDEVCLKPDGVYYDENIISACQEKGNSFNLLNQQAAALVGKLELLETAKLLFEAKAVQAAADLKTFVETEAPKKVDDEIQSMKMEKLRQIIEIGLQDFMSSEIATSGLQTNAADVESAAQTLSETMLTVIPDLEYFMSTCNTLMTGVGKNSEYLLDLCSQDSNACIEHVQGSHVGCCCGFNPITSLGTVADTSTIDGLDASQFSTSTRSRVGSRRLSAAAHSTIEICGEASKLTKSKIAQYKAKIDEVNSELWSNALEAKRAKYPAYYGRCDRKVYEGSSSPSPPPLSDAAYAAYAVGLRGSILAGLLLTLASSA